MTDSELLNELAHEFSERLRRGEQPTVEQYAHAHPELADNIRELFPVLQLMERVDTTTGPAGTAGAGRGAPGAAEPPPRLGEYRIVRPIGQGGMGTVYEAVQEPLGRHVALKLLPAHDARDARLLERFKREAQAASRLHHTNIVPVFGVGEDAGLHYYTMQLIEGRSLDKVLASADQDWTSGGGWSASPEGPHLRGFQRVAHIGLQVAEALAYAHDNGVLHRDIKPGNLLLDTRDNVWVADFGLARIDELSDLTAADDVLGTLAYVPPERFRGQTDARGDIYSLGVTLYEIVTGKQAFDRTTRAELVHCILNTTPPSPRSVDPRIPRDLETIVLKAMAREPQRRYQTAAELAEDLRRFYGDRPILARRLSVVERAWRWCRGNPLPAAACSLAALLLLAVAVVSTLAYVRQKSLGDSLQFALRRAQEAEQQGRQELFASYVSSANAARMSRRQGQRYDSLAAIRKAARLLPRLDLSAAEQQRHRDELRDLAVTCLALPDVRDIGRPVAGELLDMYRLDRSARREESGALVVSRWPAGGELARLTGVSDRTYFNFTPEADELVLVDRRAHQLLRWRLTESEPRPVAQLSRHDGELSQVEFRNDRLMLTHETDARTSVEVFDWPGGERRWEHELPYRSEVMKEVRLSPDGRFVATIQGPHGRDGPQLVRVLDIDASAEVAQLEHQDSVASVAWHPDSQTLVVGLTDSNDIVLWNIAQKQRLATLTQQRGGGPCVCLSTTGQLLCSLSRWSSTADVWHPYTQQRLLHLATWWEFEWNTLDGRVVGEAKATGGGWKYAVAEPSPVMRTLARNPVHGEVAAWRFGTVHGDGRLLAVGSDNGVTLFDLDSGLEAAHLPVGFCVCPLFIPDTGDLLTYSEHGLLRWECGKVSTGSPGTGSPTGQPSPDESSERPQRQSATAAGSRASPSPEDGTERAAIELRTADGESRWYSSTKLPCPPCRGTQVASDRAGKVIAAAAWKSVLVLHDQGERIVTLGPLRDCRGVAVSPDGRWVVTTNHEGEPIELWDADSGALIHHVGQSSSGAGSGVCFSPDGEWLSLQNATPSRLRTGTWREESSAVPGVIGFHCYSPDGRLALRLERAGAVLCDARTGHKLVTLSTPDVPAMWNATFTPDSRRVVLNSNEQRATYVWDLSRLGRELTAAGLDAVGL